METKTILAELEINKAILEDWNVVGVRPALEGEYALNEFGNPCKVQCQSQFLHKVVVERKKEWVEAEDVLKSNSIVHWRGEARLSASQEECNILCVTESRSCIVQMKKDCSIKAIPLFCIQLLKYDALDIKKNKGFKDA